MTNYFFIIFTISSLAMIFFGIKKWFQYKTQTIKEGSNSTIKVAIGAILVGFLTLTSLGTIASSIIIEILNNLFGSKLANSNTNNVLGIGGFFILSFSIVLIIYFYYKNRHKIYRRSKVQKAEYFNPKVIVNSKNIIVESSIVSKKNVKVGDENLPNE